MDDFNVSSLHESRNEWASRLVTILTPLVIDGYNSILNEAIKLCARQKEHDKYLMTFQNLIARVPKWNASIIENERIRICKKSGCNYLPDLVTCVHIIQLKILTAMRVGQKQKKMELNVPSLDEFIHKVYIHVARKIYKNVYLFETGIEPLQIQKNHRELEFLVQEAILTTLRDSIPVEVILKAYLDETVEENVTEEIKEEIIAAPSPPPSSAPASAPATANALRLSPSGGTSTTVDTSPSALPAASSSPLSSSSLKFDDLDYVSSSDGNVTSVVAPKNLERLEEISVFRNHQRRMEVDEDDDFDNEKIKIDDQALDLVLDSFEELPEI